MARYPGEESERRFAEDLLRPLVSGIFEACGLDRQDAALLVDTLLHADLRGIHSHGLLRVPVYVERLTQGGIDPKGRPCLLRETGAALLVDGGNSMGQIGATFATRQVIERARAVSVALAAVGGSNHCGAMDYYTLMAAREDMIGIAGTNAVPAMAPWGGTDKLIGLNPLSIAIPAGEEPPFVFDFSFGKTARGKVRVYEQKRLSIPDDWAFDSDGRPTSDPKIALDGLIRPIGAHKGIALAMAMGILSSVLSGAGYGAESGTSKGGPIPGADGHFFMAIHIAAFEEVSRFKRRIDGIIRQYKGAALAPGFERVYVPGELEEEIAARNRAQGIPLNERTISAILQCADKLGVDGTALRRT